jgi:hypothetical protein
MYTIELKFKGCGYTSIDTTNKIKADNIVTSIRKNGFIYTYDDGISVYHNPNYIDDIIVKPKKRR